MLKAAVTASLTACVVALAAAQAAPVSYKGLEITPIGVTRAQNAALVDCPPGTNTQRGNALQGEEFAVVTLAFKVTPAYKETFIKKPVLTDLAGKTYQTSVSIIDAGSKPEYQCGFPFRVAAGTRLASVQIDTVTIKLAGLDK